MQDIFIEKKQPTNWKPKSNVEFSWKSSLYILLTMLDCKL